MSKLIPLRRRLETSADVVLDGMKSFEITKSNNMACTVCSDVELHHMLYRLLRGKTVSCLIHGAVSIYTVGEHTTEYSSPKKRNCLRRKKVSAVTWPSIISATCGFAMPFQNLVNHHARTKLGNNDPVNNVREWIHAHAFRGGEATTQPFTFGWDLDSERKPVVVTAPTNVRS
ncbi:Hypothetical protein PHPALM_536 [Phytophthora palmivora]|uniref:Uncharacterized protein n=1 Tax=Phytophthora palmivora TaxID=4796 RepID=A0A2P4YUL4_9STRA|nr:Hypothetical protein PHPALM_536 [Phytophthora palmivora]